MDKPQNPDRTDAVNPAAVTPTPPPAADAPSPVEGGDETPPPLTPAAWLAQNGAYLVIGAALIGLIVYMSGLEGLWRWFLVVVGLSFVIFVHELGHFLTAKWCDVHVMTFSIGFGPAIPGCSFRYGETLYKLALIPLGGYVSMVGEGTEPDENEDYPRSFKNKTVGQRMLIISAGVIMNVIFGCIAFVLVYRLHGVERHSMDLASIEAGGPAWQAGVRSDSRVTKIGKTLHIPWTKPYVENPSFEELKLNVSLSADEALLFSTKPIGDYGGEFEGKITPRADSNDMSPVLGVAPAPQLTLLPPRYKNMRAMPVWYSSAAAAARVIDASPGARVVEMSDPDNPEKTTAVKNGWSEVSDRLRLLRGKPVVIQLQSNGTADEVKLPPGAFQWEDSIVGTTDPNQEEGKYDPFVVSELKLDEANTQKKAHSYFEFRRRMKQLAGKPVVLQVRRHATPADANPLSVFVPAEYHRSLGLRMRMGDVAAVRTNSPAASAGLQPEDVITRVTMTAPPPGAGALGLGATTLVADLKEFDPVKLPYDLHRISTKTAWPRYVRLTVDRPNPPGGAANGGNPDDKHKATTEVTVGPMEWDESWSFNEESTSGSVAALSIPELGIAYRVDSTIVKVKQDSPADKAGLQPKDEIIAVAFRKSTEDPADVKWHHWVKLEATRGSQKRFDRWAYIDRAFQDADYPHVQLKIRRGDTEKTIPEDLKTSWLTAEEDRAWPESDRGLYLALDKRVQKAETTWDALKFGVSRTGEFILVIYQTLKSLVTRRVSVEMVQGPINIAQTAFIAAEDPYEFLLLLGLISVNLAVVNFLPIPVLDGGHMVFLIYEKLRGKPASENVRAAATYVGLALIFLMLVFVLWQEAVQPLIRWLWR